MLVGLWVPHSAQIYLSKLLPVEKNMSFCSPILVWSCHLVTAGKHGLWVPHKQLKHCCSAIDQKHGNIDFKWVLSVKCYAYLLKLFRQKKMPWCLWELKDIFYLPPADRPGTGDYKMPDVCPSVRSSHFIKGFITPLFMSINSPNLHKRFISIKACLS